MNKLSTMTLIILLSVSFSKSQNIVWEQTYPEIGNQRISDIATIDGDIFAVGWSSYMGNTGRIMRIDSIGNLKWSKDVFFRGLNRSSLYKVEKVIGESNLYVAGYISQSGVGNYNFISKMDSTGDTLWVVTSNETGFYSLVNSMIQLKDKSIVCAGWRITQTGRDAVAWKVDSTGQTLWKKYYTFGSTEAFDITEMMDGSLILAGRNGGDNILLRIDFDGRLISDTILPGLVSGLIVTSENKVDPYNNLVGCNFVLDGSTPTGNSYVVNKQLFQTHHWTIGPNVENLTLNQDSITLYREFINGFQTGLYKLDYLNQKLDSVKFNIDNTIRDIINLTRFKNNIIISGAKGTSSNRDYWLAKIDGVGEEWIPDPCAFSPPVAGFAYDFNGGIFTLQDTSYAGLPYLDTIYTWDWTLSDGFTSNLESPVTLLDTTTTKTLDIQLIVSNWYGCKDTINQTLNFGPTGITSDIQFEEKVWPNPARDVLNISLSERPNETVLFEIYDVHGRKQVQTSFSGKDGNLNISTLASGIYFYKLSTGGFVKRGKVVKE